jgi:hypothetical protein
MRSRTARRAASLVLLVVLAGCGATRPTSPVVVDSGTAGAVAPVAPAPATFVAIESPRRAADVLAGMPVKGRAPMTGYSREQFGADWADLDGDGCDTRREVLNRDAATSTMDGEGCADQVTIIDPYSGEEVKGRAKIDIDHVVALGNAWATGAQALPADGDARLTRRQLANDPLNLIATSAHLNRQKGDADAATWLPPLDSERCAYVSRQLAVKSFYKLWLTQAEQSAMARTLATCPDEMTPTHRETSA